MPRLDRTFSHKDIIRIYDYYLTADERVMAKKHICEEVIEEDVGWPLIICVPLFEVLDMVQLVITIAVAIWPMVQLSLNVVKKLEELSHLFGWIPLFGDILKKDVDRLNKKVDELEPATKMRLDALQEYFNLVHRYFSQKCYPR